MHWVRHQMAHCSSLHVNLYYVIHHISPFIDLQLRIKSGLTLGVFHFVSVFTSNALRTKKRCSGKKNNPYLSVKGFD